MRWGRIQHEACDSSARLVFASLPNLRLETGLDRVDGPSRAARLARHEEYTVLLRKERVRRLARLAGDVLDCGRRCQPSTRQCQWLEWTGRTDVTTQNVLDLLLLETTLDDKAPRAVDGAGGTHFREHVLDDVLGLPVHTFADVGDVGEDGLLVAFTCELRRRNCVTFAGGGKECGVRGMELSVESVKELDIRRVSLRLMRLQDLNIPLRRCSHGHS